MSSVFTRLPQFDTRCCSNCGTHFEDGQPACWCFFIDKVGLALAISLPIILVIAYYLGK